MLTKRCSCCQELLPTERFPPLPGGGRRDQCDAPYCEALRHAASTAVSGALVLTFWPVPVVAIAIVVLSIIVSPLLWWSFIPLAAWIAWKLRSIPDRAIKLFDQIPAELTDRVDRLGHLRDLRNQLLRANVTITPGVERYLSETWEYGDLSIIDQRTIDAADAALRERVTADGTFSCG